MQTDARDVGSSRRFLQALGFRRPDVAGNVAAKIGSATGATTPVVQSDSAGVHASVPVEKVSTRRALDPDQMALALLEWLQAPGGRTGALSDADLREAMREMCAECDIDEVGWVAVAREFRALIGDRKRYRCVRGKRVRTYFVPPSCDFDVSRLMRAAA